VGGGVARGRVRGWAVGNGLVVDSYWQDKTCAQNGSGVPLYNNVES